MIKKKTIMNVVVILVLQGEARRGETREGEEREREAVWATKSYSVSLTSRHYYSLEALQRDFFWLKLRMWMEDDANGRGAELNLKIEDNVLRRFCAKCM